MDQFALEFLANPDEPGPPEEDEREDQNALQDADQAQQAEPDIPESGSQSRLKRRAIKLGIFKAASMQDKLLEK